VARPPEEPERFSLLGIRLVGGRLGVHRILLIAPSPGLGETRDTDLFPHGFDPTLEQVCIV
jgi:hypothetical protein